MNFTASLYEREMKKPPSKEAPEQTGAPGAPAVTAVPTGGASSVCPVTGNC